MQGYMMYCAPEESIGAPGSLSLHEASPTSPSRGLPMLGSAHPSVRAAERVEMDLVLEEDLKGGCRIFMRSRKVTSSPLVTRASSLSFQPPLESLLEL